LVHHWLPRDLSTIGDPAGADGIQLNPEALYFLILGRAYFFASDTEQALLN
jgi:hypothetical protein